MELLLSLWLMRCRYTSEGEADRHQREESKEEQEKEKEKGREDDGGQYI